MDISQVGLIVSAIVCGIQVYSFFDNKALRKESSLNTFAKADLVKSDLDSIRRSIDEQLDHIVESIEEQRHDITDTNKELHDILTTIAVIKERVNTEQNVLNKL